MSFHLAYLKLNTDFFMSGKPTSEKLQYALVPVDLPARGQWYLDRIDLNGRPMGRFPAMAEFLRTLKLRLPAQVVAELQRLGGAAHG